MILASLIFAGGVIAGTSPLTRLPSPYNPAAAEIPTDAESLAAANWAARTLGPGHQVAADSAGGLLMGSVGRQEIVTSHGDVSISRLFLSPDFDSAEAKIVRQGHIDYVYVDRRIADTRALKGFVYEPWEQDVFPYGSFVASTTVNKFSGLRDASKVFDSGNVEFFEVHRLAP